MSLTPQGKELSSIKPLKSSARTLPSRNHQKPWPGRKIDSDAKLIRHMNYTTGYAHGAEGALSVGVLEWGLLEKWAYNQRRLEAGAASTAPRDSLSSSNSSLSLSSSSDSPPCQSKQSSPSSDVWKSSSHDCNYPEGGVKSEDPGTLFEDEAKERHIISSISRFNEPSAISWELNNAKDSMAAMAATELGKPNCHPKHRRSLSFDFVNGRRLRCIDSMPKDVRSLSARNSSMEIISREILNYIGNDNETTKSGGQNDKIGKFANISSKLVQVYMADNDVEGDEADSANPTKGEEKVPSFELQRNSLFRHRSPTTHARLSMASSGFAADRDSQNIINRRSPLRRMIDPLLMKSKDHHNRILCSNSMSSNSRPSPREGLLSPEDDLGKCSSVSCICSHESGNRKAFFENKCRSSSKQALLQVVWKQDVPLIIFSANDGDILVANFKRKDYPKPDEEDGIIYNISSIQEAKKKSRAWNGFGSRRQSQGFTSTKIAQMRVSDSVLSSYISDNVSLLREFILFGHELEPSSKEPTTVSSFENELAAILMKIPLDGQGSSNSIRTFTDGGGCINSSQASVTGENEVVSDDCNMVAVLPGGNHGLSETGTPPPPLTQRWKLGGSCDCGGWDEGCSLTILSSLNHGEQNTSLHSRPGCNEDGTFRIDLSTKVRDPDGRQSFSLVAFREGLYTVEFAQPIACLQAFAICVAAIHSSARGRCHHPLPFQPCGEEVPSNPPPSPTSSASVAY